MTVVLGVAVSVLCRGFLGVSDAVRLRTRVSGFKVGVPAPKDAKTDGLSRNRFCCSLQAAILLNSVSRDKQLADSSANVLRVRN